MSTLIDVGLGLVAVFLVFSIIVSGINEWFAQAFARRGHFLRLGMRRLIDDDAVYRRVMSHPLISSLYQEAAARNKPPSYIDPRSFALALTDVLNVRAATGAGSRAGTRALTHRELRSAITSERLADSPLRAALLPIVDRAGDDLEAALRGIEGWFSSAMDRVGGWYKTRTQKMIFVIGLALAAAANVDALAIFASLNDSPDLRRQWAETAVSLRETGRVGDLELAALERRPPTEAEWRSLLPMLQGLREESGPPIGYACLGATLRTALNGPGAAAAPPGARREADCGRAFTGFLAQPVQLWLLKLLGWILTALAGTLGSVYWFGLLTKVIDLRGSGSRPAGTGAAAGA